MMWYHLFHERRLFVHVDFLQYIVTPWRLEFVNHGDYHLELCLGDTWGVHLELPAVMSK